MKNVRKGMKIMKNPHIFHTLPHILRTLKFNNFSIFLIFFHLKIQIILFIDTNQA